MHQKILKILIPVLCTLVVLTIVSWVYMGNNAKRAVVDALQVASNRMSGQQIEFSYSLSRLSGFPFNYTINIYNVTLAQKADQGDVWKIEFFDPVRVTMPLFASDVRIVVPTQAELYYYLDDSRQKYLVNTNVPLAASVRFSQDQILPWWLGRNTVMSDADVALERIFAAVPQMEIQREEDIAGAADEDEWLISEGYEVLCKGAEIYLEFDDTLLDREKMTVDVQMRGLSPSLLPKGWKVFGGKDAVLGGHGIFNMPDESDIYAGDPLSIELKSLHYHTQSYDFFAYGRAAYTSDGILDAANLDMKVSDMPAAIKHLSPWLDANDRLDHYKDTAWYRKRLEGYVQKYLLSSGSGEGEEKVAHAVLSVENGDDVYVNDAALKDVRSQYRRIFVPGSRKAVRQKVVPNVRKTSKTEEKTKKVNKKPARKRSNFYSKGDRYNIMRRRRN